MNTVFVTDLPFHVAVIWAVPPSGADAPCASSRSRSFALRGTSRLRACLRWTVRGLRHDLRFVTVVVENMVRTWAPDDFWQVAQPLIPVPAKRPQGGGKQRADDRAVLAAVVYLVQVGCSWWKLPAEMFGISRATAHRRFTEWTNAGLWELLHQQFLHRLGVVSEIDWSRAIVDSISVRAEKGGRRRGQTRSTAANRARRSMCCATAAVCR